MRLRVVFASLILICALSLAFLAGNQTSTASTSQNTPEPADSSVEVAASPAPTATATPLPGAVGPLEFPPGVNPLTGLPVDDAGALERRPLVVKISNAPPLVRPQSGIGQADLVFEHYAEGGLTRFSAIFYGQSPARVGSIRSARLIDFELVPMYQGMLAFSGASLGVEKFIFGSAYVVEELCSGKEGDARTACEADALQVAPPGDKPPSEFADRAFKGVLYGPPYYWRDESIPVPHNMFASTAALWELAASQGLAQRPDLKGLTFYADPLLGESGPGSVLDVRYRATRVRWEYDAATGRYLRFADDQPHFDANTQEQVSAANVVVIYAGHYLTDIVESVWQGSVSYSWQITVWPEGDAVLFRDGKRYEGRWVRAVRGDAISLHTKDGAPLYLKPGNTWFQLVPLPEQMNPDEEWVRVE